MGNICTLRRVNHPGVQSDNSIQPAASILRQKKLPYKCKELLSAVTSGHNGELNAN